MAKAIVSVLPFKVFPYIDNASVVFITFVHPPLLSRSSVGVGVSLNKQSAREGSGSELAPTELLG